MGGTGSGGGGGALDLDSDKRRDARRNEKPRCGTAVSATAAELAAIVLSVDELLLSHRTATAGYMRVWNVPPSTVM